MVTARDHARARAWSRRECTVRLWGGPEAGLAQSPWWAFVMGAVGILLALAVLIVWGAGVLG